MTTNNLTSSWPDKLRFVPAGLQYFLIVFATGFVLGTIRTMVLEPRLGVRYAELIEAPFMLAAILLAARWAVTRHRLRRSFELIATGLLAFTCLLAVEFSVVLWLRGLTFNEYVQSRDPIAGAVYIVLLATYGLMPLHFGKAFYDEP